MHRASACGVIRDTSTRRDHGTSTSDRVFRASARSFLRGASTCCVCCASASGRVYRASAGPRSNCPKRMTASLSCKCRSRIFMPAQQRPQGSNRLSILISSLQRQQYSRDAVAQARHQQVEQFCMLPSWTSQHRRPIVCSFLKADRVAAPYTSKLEKMSRGSTTSLHSLSLCSLISRRSRRKPRWKKTTRKDITRRLCPNPPRVALKGSTRWKSYRTRKRFLSGSLINSRRSLRPQCPAPLSRPR